MKICITLIIPSYKKKHMRHIQCFSNKKRKASRLKKKKKDKPQVIVEKKNPHVN